MAATVSVGWEKILTAERKVIVLIDNISILWTMIIIPLHCHVPRKSSRSSSLFVMVLPFKWLPGNILPHFIEAGRFGTHPHRPHSVIIPWAFNFLGCYLPSLNYLLNLSQIGVLFELGYLDRFMYSSKSHIDTLQLLKETPSRSRTSTGILLLTAL